MERGRQLIRSKILMSTLKGLTMIICCKFKKNLINLWLYTHLFMFWSMYIAACQGQTTPGDIILMSTETTCHFRHLLQISKISLSSLILFNFFHDFIHVYSPAAGPDNPLGMKFWCQQEHFVTSVFVASFINISLKSDIILFFHDFIYVYSPRGRGSQPPGDKVWFQQKRLVTSFICCKFQKKCLWSLFLNIFFMI